MINKDVNVLLLQEA